MLLAPQVWIVQNPALLVGELMDVSSWGPALNSVGWFIPAYVQMREIHSLVDKISSSQGRFSQDDLEKELAQIYNPINLAAMVCHRFPDVPIIQDFRITIEEAHLFLWLQ